MLSSSGFLKLFRDGFTKGDPSILYDKSLPYERDISLAAVDLDGDGAEELLCSGFGGAGGTHALKVLKLERDKARIIFYDSSRFTMHIFRSIEDSSFSIANAGFDFVFDGNKKMHPKEFKIYTLNDGQFIKTREMKANDFLATIKKIGDRRSTRKSSRPVIIYE